MNDVFEGLVPLLGCPLVQVPEIVDGKLQSPYLDHNVPSWEALYPFAAFDGIKFSDKAKDQLIAIFISSDDRLFAGNCNLQQDQEIYEFHQEKAIQIGVLPPGAGLLLMALIEMLVQQFRNHSQFPVFLLASLYAVSNTIYGRTLALNTEKKDPKENAQLIINNIKHSQAKKAF